MIDVFCIHPKATDIDSFLKLTCLEGHIDKSSLRWNPDHPSILIATEWTFYRKDLFLQFAKLYKDAELKICWMGEAVSGDLNVFDYCIGFDCNRYSDDRFIRLPSPLDMFHRFISKRENEIVDTATAAKCLNEKTSFCNFLYSNAKSHPMRDNLFYAVSNYKKVDSLGRHLNNVATPGTGYEGHTMECISIKSPYKFSIASENASYNGYTSEKIFTSLIAHTVPIYWGNPTIKSDVNPECFINVADFDSLDAVIERIKEIDSSAELWQQYISAPWLLPEQVEMHRRRSDEYYSKMQFILSGNAPKQVPEGFHVELYREQFFKSGFAFNKTISKRLSRLLSLIRGKLS